MCQCQGDRATCPAGQGQKLVSDGGNLVQMSTFIQSKYVNNIYYDHLHGRIFLLQALTEAIKSGEIGEVNQVIVPFGWY